MIYYFLLLCLSWFAFFDSIKQTSLIMGREAFASYKSFYMFLYFFLVSSLTLLTSLRGGMGTDWIVYKKMFDVYKTAHGGGRRLSIVA